MKETFSAKINRMIYKEERRMERIMVHKLSKVLPGKITATIFLDRAAFSGDISLDTTVTINDDGVHMLINKRGIHILGTNISEGTVDNIKLILDKILFTNEIIRGQSKI